MVQTHPTDATVPTPIAGSAEGWALDPDVTFLNHGSFGARRNAVVEAQADWRRQFERSPVAFLDRDRDRLQTEARNDVAEFLRIPERGLAFVTNASDGMNAVLRSIQFARGDRVITTSHVYGAVRQTLHFVTERAGAELVEINVPAPCPNGSTVTDAIRRALEDGARLLVIDHVTSPTALRLPIGDIVALAHERGVPVLVDGAHAPGMLEDPVNEAGADYYTGNLHKWVNAPSGAAFLHVRDSDALPEIRPTVISHFHTEGFERAFLWQGTRDLSPWLSVPTAIAEGAAFSGGWPAIRAYNNALTAWVRTRLTAALGTEASGPADMLCSMVAVQLPERITGRFEDAADLNVALYERFRIEVPVFAFQDHWWIRPSCQIYNRPEHYDALVDALETLGHAR